MHYKDSLSHIFSLIPSSCLTVIAVVFVHPFWLPILVPVHQRKHLSELPNLHETK